MNPSAAIIDQYEKQAIQGYPWKRKNWYYHRAIYDLISFLVPAGKSVLELGCGTGDLLSRVKPRRGVGIDFSPMTISLAKDRHPNYEFHLMDAADISLTEKFEVVILSDLVGELEDVWQVFKCLHRVTEPGSRIVVTYFNYLWAPFLKFAELAGLKMPQNYQNWLSPSDLSNFLTLTGFEVIKRGWRTLLPHRIPLLSIIFNRHLAYLPALRNLCVTQYLVARPTPLLQHTPATEPSCSVIVPTRNERGNIEEAVTRIPSMGRHTEIIFVDGCSTDGTVSEIERMISQFGQQKDIRLVHQVPVTDLPVGERESGKMLKLGKGDAVRKGFDQATGDILMILDADLTVPPEELTTFFTLAVERSGELIMGTRLVYPMEKQAMRFLNILANKLFSMLFTWLLDQPVKDTLCGTKVLWRADYQMIKHGRTYFGDFDPFGDFDLIFGAAKLNLKIAELPIRYRQRVYGDIKIERFRHGVILLKMCWIAFKKFKLMDSVLS
jgi:glycosyltransferase involved in cell wall biosynthesis/SAM-dependent methyltransferase